MEALWRDNAGFVLFNKLMVRDAEKCKMWHFFFLFLVSKTFTYFILLKKCCNFCPQYYRMSIKCLNSSGIFVGPGEGFLSFSTFRKTASAFSSSPFYGLMLVWTKVFSVRKERGPSSGASAFCAAAQQPPGPFDSSL